MSDPAQAEAHVPEDRAAALRVLYLGLGSLILTAAGPFSCYCTSVLALPLGVLGLLGVSSLPTEDPVAAAVRGPAAMASVVGTLVGLFYVLIFVLYAAVVMFAVAAGIAEEL